MKKTPERIGGRKVRRCRAGRHGLAMGGKDRRSRHLRTKSRMYAFILSESRYRYRTVRFITLQRVQTLNPIATPMSWSTIDGKTFDPKNEGIFLR
jgi:hypothetical protein